jgi:2-amino-4-hydroxy-6-hydroxymethyldihydropteridine diphosphokinase
MARAFIGLGSNLGERETTIRGAVGELASLGDVVAVSPIYETEPVGFRDQPDFLNAAVELETDLEPGDLLEGLLSIERALGRKRTFPNAPRTIDLDLLLYGDQVISTPELTLPHPRLHERAFVLVPLAKLVPDLILPVLGKTVSDALAQTDSGVVRPFSSELKSDSRHL